MALCHVLLKTYGLNDVLLLASFFTMHDESLERYYGSEIKSGMPSPPDEKGNIVNDMILRFKHSLAPTEKSKNKTTELLKKVFTPNSSTTTNKDAMPPRDLPKDGKSIITLFLIHY